VRAVLHEIRPSILRRMRELEALDAEQRQAGLPAQARLCAVPPETGRLLALLAAGAPAGRRVEVGTSGGYSALWLCLAGADAGTILRTFEAREDKAAIARETFRLAEVEALVELTVGDARGRLARETGIGFAFVDHAKERYRDAFDELVPNLVPGGVLVADNILSHAEVLDGFVREVEADARVDSVVLSVGKGLLVCRRPVTRA
jgi:caffeoyl-CoA O-methyltransferase